MTSFNKIISFCTIVLSDIIQRRSYWRLTREKQSVMSDVWPDYRPTMRNTHNNTKTPLHWNDVSLQINQSDYNSIILGRSYKRIMWIFLIKCTKYETAELNLFLLEVKISLILSVCSCFHPPRDKTSDSSLHIWHLTGLQARNGIYVTLWGRYCSNVKVFHRSQVRVVGLSPQRDIPGLLVLSKSVQRLVASLIYCGHIIRSSYCRVIKQQHAFGE